MIEVVSDYIAALERVADAADTLPLRAAIGEPEWEELNSALCALAEIEGRLSSAA